jgi:hypothetical protein
VLTFWRIVVLVTGRREIRRKKKKMNWKKNSGGKGRKMYEDEGKGKKSPENKGSKEVKEEVFLLLFLDHSLSSSLLMPV